MKTIQLMSSFFLSSRPLVMPRQLGMAEAPGMRREWIIRTTTLHLAMRWITARVKHAASWDLA